MKLSPEQMIDWFLAAFPEFPPENRSQWLAWLETPPQGASRSEVISGMKQAMNDALTMAKDRPAQERQKIDATLAAKGLPSLRKMEAILKKKHQRILARGRIKDDEEFYIVAEILSDVDFPISGLERNKLGEISRDYEVRGE